MNIAHLKIAKEEKLLNPVQKEFNRLNDRIKKIKNDIEKISVKTDIIRNFQLERMVPLKKQWFKMRFKTIKKMDDLYRSANLTRMQKENLANIILEDASTFRIDAPPDFTGIAEIDDIHEKYSKLLYSEDELKELETNELDSLKALAQDMLGIDIDGIENIPQEEYQDFFRRKVEEKMSAKMNNQDAWEHWQRRENPRKSKKTAAQQLKEDAKKAEIEASLKTLREVYFDLVKKLHPDHEKDETLRLEKTEQMKLVIEAYEKKDLASLLVMQIKWLQYTDKDPEQQPDEVLAKYNKVLKMHIKNLEGEYNTLCFCSLPFDTDFETFGLLRKNEKALLNSLAEYERYMKHDIRVAKSLLMQIGTPAGLNRHIQEREEEEEIDHLFMEIFSARY